MAKLLMPAPKAPDPHATKLGLATIPVTAGASLFLGYRMAPPLAPPPERMFNLSGWLSFSRLLPVRYYGTVGLASAAASAACCRLVQYKAGA